MEIIINNTFNNKFPDGKTYRTHQIKLFDIYGTLYFNVDELPAKNGGTYLKFPETIWDKELYKSSEYKKGFTKHIIPDKLLVDNIWRLIGKLNDANNQEQTQQPTQQPTQEENINLDDIKF